MTRKRTLSAALATTASVALLAGLSPAQAQMGGSPGGPCSTTVTGPATANCTLPSSSAPGAGSFPGSFLVPGTSTSFAVHGIIYFEIDRDMGVHQGDTSAGIGGIVLEGQGAAAQTHSANGGLNMNDKATRPNIETRTPTAYGELKTYIEMDFNQTAGVELNGNADALRLRMAYGTLGPWLMGQTLTLYEDPQSWPDTADASQDVGIVQSGIVRKPQVRYTWLAGNGISVGSSVELPTYSTSLGPTVGWAANTAAVSTLSPANSAGSLPAFNPYTGAASATANNGGYVQWPKFVVAPQWDQPWGHLRLAVEAGLNEIRSSSALLSTDSPTHTSFQNGEYAVGLTGHVNTWGKDTLRGGFRYNYGASDYSDDMLEGGHLYNTTTGGQATVKMWTFYGGYEHFFTSQWRGNLSAGYAKISGNPGWTSAATLAGVERFHYSTHVNFIYAPVPQLDIITEWMRDYRKVYSGANGTTDRLEEQFKFYF